ncbi:arsenate reductase [Proteiniborus sp. DW1]|uniref:arsenate reductase family protein n=1 Tax=Proteiniborus sp. DW1 TaxID=1889883 RepID=UPI00092E05B4|nr:arsenate reductase family protein [Proteiniborus sp. DW1]SCG84343.1 arsenate reductase [Proteiniborus sp. DW1]
MIFLCYPKCTTCQKAKKWLKANEVAFEERHIKENNPSIEELKSWHKTSGLALKKFFNTSGQLYRELKLKDKLPTMSEDEQYNLLASDGMLVKRPILIGDDFVLVGFKETDWKTALDIE